MGLLCVEEEMRSNSMIDIFFEAYRARMTGFDDPAAMRAGSRFAETRMK